MLMLERVFLPKRTNRIATSVTRTPRCLLPQGKQVAIRDVEDPTFAPRRFGPTRTPDPGERACNISEPNSTQVGQRDNPKRNIRSAGQLEKWPFGGFYQTHPHQCQHIHQLASFAEQKPSLGGRIVILAAPLEFIQSIQDIFSDLSPNPKCISNRAKRNLPTVVLDEKAIVMRTPCTNGQISDEKRRSSRTNVNQFVSRCVSVMYAKY